MTTVSAKTPNYGNWVSKRMLYLFGFLGTIFAALSLLSIYSLVVTTLFYLSFAYFAYARYKFSPRGGDIENKIRNSALTHLDWDGEGKAIDIGCGNAPLTVRLSQKYPQAQVTGIDYWGSKWEYSKEVCEKNAQIEGVADRVTFQKASATQLPFDAEYFDAAVSNLVFHEVSNAKNKREVIREALRVVKKGGKFAFQDLFLDQKIYGDIDGLLAEIKSWGVEKVEFADTSRAEFIPDPLRLKFMVGAIGVVYGTK